MSIATISSPSRRRFLLGSAATLGSAVVAAPRPVQASRRPARNLIVVMASGGWDTMYALDPKPDGTTLARPDGDLRYFGNIPLWTHESRPAVTRFFEAYSDLCAVVNGIHTQSISHADCTTRLLTGTPSDANPDLGAIAAFELGRDLAAPYLVLGQTSYAGPYASLSARVGPVNQIITLLDPSFGYPSTHGPAFTPDDLEDQLIRQFIHGRVARERVRFQGATSNLDRANEFADSVERADRLKGLADFGDFGYVRDLPTQAALALDAIEQDVSWAAQIELGGWDTHYDNSGQTNRYEAFFTGLRALIDDLLRRPGRRGSQTMFDETIVAVVSEMGRTPRLNGSGGKDHWPVTSALVLGGGVAGGRTYGKTDTALQAVPIDLATGDERSDGEQLQSHSFVAGILELCGIDSGVHLPHAEPLRAFAA